jgi:hypothetical protein
VHRAKELTIPADDAVKSAMSGMAVHSQSPFRQVEPIRLALEVREKVRQLRLRPGGRPACM